MAFGPDPSVAAQWEDLTIYQNHDADLLISLIDPTTITLQNPLGNAYNLTGLTVSLVRKATRDTADAQGKTYTCTIQGSPTAGNATVTLPAADNSLAGVDWYRVDLIGSETKAVKFGRLTVYAV